jgi:hypothetical protein
VRIHEKEYWEVEVFWQTQLEVLSVLVSVALLIAMCMHANWTRTAWLQMRLKYYSSTILLQSEHQQEQVSPMVVLSSSLSVAVVQENWQLSICQR